MRKLAGVIAAAALMGGSGAAWAQAASDKLLTTLSPAEVRALAVETGGMPGAIEELDNGEYQMEIVYPDDLPVYFEGWSCTGEGETRRCAEFEIHVLFELDSEALARAKEHEIAIVWLSDLAIGTRLKLWRMDSLAGMTRGRAQGVFETFLETVGVAREIAFAKESGAGAAGK